MTDGFLRNNSVISNSSFIEYEYGRVWWSHLSSWIQSVFIHPIRKTSGLTLVFLFSVLHLGCPFRRASFGVRSTDGGYRGRSSHRYCSFYFWGWWYLSVCFSSLLSLPFQCLWFLRLIVMREWHICYLGTLLRLCRVGSQSPSMLFMQMVFFAIQDVVL